MHITRQTIDSSRPKRKTIISSSEYNKVVVDGSKQRNIIFIDSSERKYNTQKNRVQPDFYTKSNGKLDNKYYQHDDHHHRATKKHNQHENISPREKTRKNGQLNISQRNPYSNSRRQVVNSGYTEQNNHRTTSRFSQKSVAEASFKRRYDSGEAVYQQDRAKRNASMVRFPDSRDMKRSFSSQGKSLNEPSQAKKRLMMRTKTMASGREDKYFQPVKKDTKSNRPTYPMEQKNRAGYTENSPRDKRGYTENSPRDKNRGAYTENSKGPSYGYTKQQNPKPNNDIHHQTSSSYRNKSSSFNSATASREVDKGHRRPQYPHLSAQSTAESIGNHKLHSNEVRVPFSTGKSLEKPRPSNKMANKFGRTTTMKYCPVEPESEDDDDEVENHANSFITRRLREQRSMSPKPTDKMRTDSQHSGNMQGELLEAVSNDSFVPIVVHEQENHFWRHFDFVMPLGEGKDCTVVLAKSKCDGLNYAVKQLKLSKVMTWRMIETQVKIHCMFDHPHLLKVFEIHSVSRKCQLLFATANDSELPQLIGRNGLSNICATYMMFFYLS